MKLLTLLAIALLTVSSFADDLTIHLNYLARTQLEAEIGAVKMKDSINKDATQLSLESKAITGPDGFTYWIARLTIQVKSEDLQNPPQFEVPQAPKKYD